MALNKDKVYTDTNWKGSIMFAYNKEFRYYSYIDTTQFTSDGKVMFKQAYNKCNAGKPSKVGEYILDRNTIQEVQFKGKTMDYKKSNIIVASSNYSLQAFETEEDAYEYIQDKLEEKPKTQFTMYKPYQEIKPKRFDLASLITLIKS